MKDDHEQIRETVIRLKKEYNFRGLLHFTDFSNLTSIINIGYLCSRALCYANNIEFEDALIHENAIHIANEVKNYTRFYYVEKNKYDSMSNLPIPVYLLFSHELIYLDLAIYTDGDADSGYAKYGANYEFFNYLIDWDIVFDKKTSSDNFKGPLKQSFERKRRSELLVDEPVPLKFLNNIIFRCDADYKRACNLFGKNKLYTVEPNMFFNEKNYIKDYNIVYNPLIDSDAFILHFSSNLPVKNDVQHEYAIFDLNGKLIRKAQVNFLESSSTDFNVEVNNLPKCPFKFEFWFYGILCIEETIG
ncbi:MAG: DarT ssDNA thymidine ADP-ribosyltransferase family protein [Sedimentibacter sp.]|uniref:DarT ssDNA thymidine ADP-ribosyltransferase family protein n=1 Tax=Sedimentibacter sp. TaxID=1960295 RepID=UPI00298123EE|nr:DarT ssDNA thymidine ADP-ribosyltransferase family protein [Sedimentibacter sp.]MDW5298572.1 DarT ssDNA thymidine ADP-ribosyltransferase family protein [Sedimentibacter sp.]